MSKIIEWIERKSKMLIHSRPIQIGKRSGSMRFWSRRRNENRIFFNALFGKKEEENAPN